MSNETRRPPISRAEARRRARQLERGDGVSDSEDVEPSAEAEARPSGPAGLLGRLFPPAPPLPGKPDPLANFTYSGPLRGVVAGLYVLAFNPRGWLLPGIVWAVAQMLSYVNLLTAAAYAGQLLRHRTTELRPDRDRRPAGDRLRRGGRGLDRLAAAVAVRAGGEHRRHVDPGHHPGVADRACPAPEGATFGSLFLAIILNQILQLQWALGALIGWYGGYLRRRMTVTAPNGGQGNRRRR